MGSRPQLNTVEDIFKAQPVDVDADSEHPVPISNFLNAQCKSGFDAVRRRSRSDPERELTLARLRLLGDFARHAAAELQGHP